MMNVLTEYSEIKTVVECVIIEAKYYYNMSLWSSESHMLLVIWCIRGWWCNVCSLSYHLISCQDMRTRLPFDVMLFFLFYPQAYVYFIWRHYITVKRKILYTFVIAKYSFQIKWFKTVIKYYYRTYDIRVFSLNVDIALYKVSNNILRFHNMI